MLNSLEDLTKRFAAKNAEIAYYQERQWLIVDARDSPIDDGEIAALAEIAEFSHLVDLNLAGSQITNASMAYIARCIRLKSIDLGRTRCDERCLESLTALGELKGLGLSQIRLTTKFAIILQMPSLDLLDLSQSHPTRDEVRSLLTWTKISNLNLSGNGFHPEDFADMNVLDDDSRLMSIDFDNGVRVAIERPRFVPNQCDR